MLERVKKPSNVIFKILLLHGLISNFKTLIKRPCLERIFSIYKG